MLFTKMYDDGAAGGINAGFQESGGQVPPSTTQANAMTITPTTKAPEGMGVETDDEVIHPEREEKKRPDSIAEIEAMNAAALGEEGAEGEEGGEDAEGFYADEAEFLKELGADYEEYGTVQEALTGMNKKLKEFSGQYEQVKRLSDTLTGISQKLHIPIDGLVEILNNLDPGGNATGAANFQNLSNVLSKSRFQSEGDKQFFGDIGTAIMNDLTPHVEGMIARGFNALKGNIENLEFEFAMNRFLGKKDKDGNAVNSVWNGRDQEIRDFLNQYPHMKGKPNMIEWATRGITAGKEPASHKKQVSDEAKKRVQEIQKKKRLLRQGAGGRGVETAGGGQITDPGKMDHKQKGDYIDQLEEKGVRLSTRRH